MTNASKIVRIFISSTFRDMHGEREELVKRVFPQVRRACEQRGLSFLDVDLRWGVTDEQKAEGQVLPICLNEISRCQPFLIGLLGHYYGSLADEIPRDLLDQEPWLNEHRDKSITELEILYGVLNDPRTARRAHFYFRDPAYLDCFPPEQRRHIEEQDLERCAKLERLKGAIRQSGVAVRESYPDVETLGRWVFEDLIAAINAEFPAAAAADPLDRERAEQEAFVQRLKLGFVERKQAFGRLDAHVASDGPPLTVLGDVGGGKSTLLANWVLAYQQSYPEAALLAHFIGSTPESTNWSAMLRRLIGELNRRFVLSEPIPQDGDALRRAFTSTLRAVAHRGRLILVIDALDQLEELGGALDLLWLSPELPKNIRLIVSSMAGRAGNELKRRQWPTFIVQPLSKNDRSAVITSYLQEYSKTLSPERVQRIAAAPPTSNALYLRSFLEELRLLGLHERLDEHMAVYLSSRNTSELFERILQRFETDYDRDRPGLVREAMSLLWAARRGLSEAELLDLLAVGDEPLPKAIWAPFYLAARQVLVEQSTLIRFFHQQFRDTVGRKYLANPQDQQTAHLRLADYFTMWVSAERKWQELPWQLVQVQAWQRLVELLTEPAFLESAWHHQSAEVLSWCSLLEARSPFRLVEVYADLLRHPESHSVVFAECVASLLEDLGCWHEAIPLRKHITDRLRDLPDWLAVQRSLIRQARVLCDRGHAYDAMAALCEAERIGHAFKNHEDLARSLVGQAAVYQAWGRYEDSVGLIDEADPLCRRIDFADGLQEVLGLRATLLQERGEFSNALALVEERERLCRGSGLQEGLARTLGQQCQLLGMFGDCESALKLQEEEQRIYSSLGSKGGVGQAKSHKARLLQRQRRWQEAMRLYSEHERACRQMGNVRELAECFEGQAAICEALGNRTEAEQLRADIINIRTRATLTLLLLGRYDGLRGGHDSNALSVE